MDSSFRSALLAAGLSVFLSTALPGCGGSGGEPPSPPAAQKDPAAPKGPSGEGRAARNAALDEGVVATVDGEEVSEEEFAGALSAASFLAKQATFEGRMDVLKGRIDNILVEHAAKDAGILERPMVKRMIERNGRNNTAWIARQQLISEVKVSEEEVDDAFEPPGEILDLTVLLATDREAAEEALARVRGGEEFTDVAKEVSISPGAPTGNVRRLGFERGEGMYPPDVEDAVFDLEVGEISEPLDTPVGPLVVRVDKRRRLSEEELEKLRTSLKMTLLQRAAGSRITEVLDGRKEEGEVTVIRETFAGDDLPDPAANAAALWRALEAIEVARVDGTLLTMGDLFRSGMDYQLTMGKAPEGREEPYRSLLEQAVDRFYLDAYGKEAGLDTQPGVVLAVKGYTRQILPEQYTADIILSINEEDLDMERAGTFFEQNRGRYLDAEHFDLSQILVRREEEARALLDRVTGGEDFAALAREFSLDGSASSGGVMDNVTAGELEAIFGSGGVSELIVRGRQGRFDPLLLRTTAGFHIVRIREFNDVGEGDFEDVRERVLPDFLLFSRQEAVSKRIGELRAVADIVIDEEKVRNATPAAPQPGSGITPHGGGAGSSRGASPHGGGGSPHGGTAPGRGGASPHGGSNPSVPLR